MSGTDCDTTSNYLTPGGECIPKTCALAIPYHDYKSCGGYGQCNPNDSGKVYSCTCNEGTDTQPMPTGSTCGACSGSNKPDLVSTNGCMVSDCKANTSDTSDCSGHGACQKGDKTQNKVMCDCAPGFSGTYCDTCATGYTSPDKNTKTCQTCDTGYKSSTYTDSESVSFVKCYVNKCDPDTTNTLCTTDTTVTGGTATCALQNETWQCVCATTMLDKNTYCKTCAAGYSWNSTDPSARSCVTSQCWSSTMTQECTNQYAGTCQYGESPSCKCNALTKAVTDGSTNYCGTCSASNMDIEKGCLCKVGYKLVKNNDTYSCQSQTCVTSTTIAVMPGCNALYNDYKSFVNEAGDFDYTLYSTLWSRCACSGFGTCNESTNSCSSCDSGYTVNPSQACAVCNDTAKRFFKNLIEDESNKQSVFCFDDTCTENGSDCSGYGTCGISGSGDSAALACTCNSGTGLDASSKCASCTNKDYVFLQPLQTEEEESKGEGEKTINTKAATAGPAAQCVANNCKTPGNESTNCNNVGTCGLVWDTANPTVAVSQCSCGDLIDNCTSCKDPEYEPLHTTCYKANCNKTESSVCDGNGTCSSLEGTTLNCSCNIQFKLSTSKSRCNTCADGYTGGSLGVEGFCLTCKDGYKAMVDGTENTSSVMCLVNSCPTDGCNTEGNSSNSCKISSNKWQCVCAQGYLQKTVDGKGCNSCAAGYRRDPSITDRVVCRPSTCTSDVYDSSTPEAEPKSLVECSTTSSGVSKGVCTLNSQTNSFSCVCNSRFIGQLCDTCGYVDSTGKEVSDENMITDADILDITTGYVATDICKCKESFRFGDDGSGNTHCLANYCLVSRKSCNNNTATLLSSTSKWNDYMECCGVSGANFSDSDVSARSDDVQKLVPSDVCQVKNGSYRCLNCGSYSIFSANYKCAQCRDSINGRTAVKVGNQCVEDGCKKTCSGAGVCVSSNGVGSCTCMSAQLSSSDSCSTCNVPSGAIFDSASSKCACPASEYAIDTTKTQTCKGEGSSWSWTSLTTSSSKCIDRGCGTDGACYGHGTCTCTDVTDAAAAITGIKLSCTSCDTGYTQASNCEDCSDGYRKGPVSKTECVVDDCTDASTGRICNGLGTCTQERTVTTTVNGVETKVKHAYCACNKNADRVYKGEPDCNTCITGYTFKPSTTICVENICGTPDSDGNINNDVQCNNVGTCSYERAYNKWRCKCNDSKYDTSTACTDCKENIDKGYTVRDSANGCVCLESKNLQEHPTLKTCVEVNCKAEGASVDCNGKGTCVAGDTEYECECQYGEDKANYCATCLEPTVTETGYTYASYPQTETVEGVSQTICYVNNCEKTKLQDDTTQCYGLGSCVKDPTSVSFVCECQAGYTSNSQCRVCADGYQRASDNVHCEKIPFKMPAAGYVGIVFGVLLVIGTIVGMVYYRWKSKKIAEENERKITVDRTKIAQQPVVEVTV